ncbi:MAG: ABC transporter [Planctomycetaceae bacterium]|nr:ABC transporter [Planctomycetaceae bacterium]
MQTFGRLIPFLMPHRRKIATSAFFAVIVALLWAVNLSFTFLVVKVLLQGESLPSYVANRIEASQSDIKGHSNSLASLDSRLTAAQATRDKDDETVVAIYKEKSRQQRKLSAASRRLLVLSWVQANVIPLVPEDQFDTYALILGLLVFLTAMKGTSVFIQDYLIGSVVELVMMGLRKACFRRVLKVDYQTLSNNGTSDLVARFTNDITMLATGLLLLGGKVIREPLKAVACIGFAFFFNWQLTLLSLLMVPLIAVVFYRFGKTLKQASHHTMESMSRIYKTLEETFDGLKVVIAFNSARRHRRQFHQETKEYYRKSMKVLQVDALTSPTTELLGILAVCLAVLPGAYLVLREVTLIWGIKLTSTKMDIADLSTLYALLIGTLDPIRKLSSVYTKLKRSAAAADRIFELMDMESKVQSPEQPKILGRHRKSITFNDVKFKYATNDEADTRPVVLRGIDLSISFGEAVAIVGENGCGKSTLLSLLPRYFDVDSGTVEVDEVNIRDVSLGELRSQVAIVTQETILFDDTIAGNIRYGRPSATDEEVAAAAKQAYVTSFLEQMPDGLETRVGEKGRQLSGGQRQRVALARAILRDPSILILDEATSAIDAQSEALIHEVLADFTKNRTTFLITHAINQSILNFVTQIVVMDEGKVVAIGTHEQLRETSPLYCKLYQSQIRQQTPEYNEDFAPDIDDTPHFIPFPSRAKSSDDEDFPDPALRPAR